MSALRFKDRIRIESGDVAIDPEFGAAASVWVPVCEVSAEIEDVRPNRSRSESTKNNVQLSVATALIRIRFRPGITAEMRIVELTGARRTMSIVGGPAAIRGRRELEFAVEEFSS